MEPALNPGLEAQAAARIHRLGKTLSTPLSKSTDLDSSKPGADNLAIHKSIDGIVSYRCLAMSWNALQVRQR